MGGFARAVKGKWFPEPLPPAGSFKNQTILVTGGTSGLGIAFAIHVLNLGAKEIIITARNNPRGQEAKGKIEAETGASGKVTVMELEMDNYSSIISFTEQVKARYSNNGGLDFIVFNAGITNPVFVKSRAGWEEVIQVNTLSTTLLALLLLPWMKQLAAQRQSPAHMTFVSSGQHTEPPVQDWVRWADKDHGVLAHYNEEENWPTYTIGAIYGISKLLLEYAIKELCKLALDPHGQPQVIINSVCPGPVNTNLSRTMEAHSFFFRLLTPAFKAVLTKTPDSGARVYLAAGLTGKEGHGKFIRFYLTDDEYNARAAPFFASEGGRKIQGLVWEEMVGILGAEVPEVKQIVASLKA